MEYFRDDQKEMNPSVCSLECDFIDQNEASTKMECERDDKQELNRLECVECGKGFSSPWNLQRHSKLHKQETEFRPFGCELCGKRFKQNQHLDVHKKSIHEKVTRTYKCDICGNKFKQLGHLKTKQIVHEEAAIRRYDCDICGLKFKQLGILKTHKKTIHEIDNNRPNVCDICRCGFAMPGTLKMHKNKMHGSQSHTPKSMKQSMRTHTDELKILKMKNGSEKEIFVDDTRNGDVINNNCDAVKGTSFNSKFLSEFRTEKIIGRGAFGFIFEATNLFDEATYAIKMVAVKSRDQINERKFGEVRTLAKLYHPAIVRYHSSWIEKPPKGWKYPTSGKVRYFGQSYEQVLLCLFREYFTFNAYLADLDALQLHMKKYKNFVDRNFTFIFIQMEHCKESLAEWLNRHMVERNQNLIRSWFKQIISAVEYIHSKHILHRDLKPNNILVTSEDTVKICDLGISTDCATENSESSLQIRTCIGTELYKAPEQKYLYDKRVDIFSLGLILIEMCVPLTMEQKHEVFATGDNLVEKERREIMKMEESLALNCHHYRTELSSRTKLSSHLCNRAPRMYSLTFAVGNHRLFYKILDLRIADEQMDLATKLTNLDRDMRPRFEEIRNHPYNNLTNPSPFHPQTEISAQAPLLFFSIVTFMYRAFDLGLAYVHAMTCYIFEVICYVYGEIRNEFSVTNFPFLENASIFFV
ncbi:hypothetical protein PRIPAC_91435, partial [Pristionchus pacificus]|uniref:Uncharacterized protein n=1 Tax=Pristionchus pacificus TaxID=54126 RepID=A0A2A6CYD2_PRIPA